jgi:hypothetical protein
MWRNKMKNKDLLDLIHEKTHLKNEDGDDVPFFSFTFDITDTIDLDMSEEDIATTALENGYTVYKSFPEETMVGGLILCAPGCVKEAIDKMYQEFYGEVPNIELWEPEEIEIPINEKNLFDVSESPFNLETGHTLEEYMEKFSNLYDVGALWDYSEEDLFNKWEEEGPESFTGDTFWLIDGRYYEVPVSNGKLLEEMTKKEKEDAILKRADVDGFNKPKRTPNHPTKSHIVVAKEGDNIKTIRFGEQGAETAGKPKEGESERMKAKRKSFKARHAKNIAKGKMSAAFWADKIKW